jgi:ABC-type multidrug transport system ATPase subunit
MNVACQGDGTTGTVTFASHAVHAEFSGLRRTIGLVPQDDVVARGRR